MKNVTLDFHGTKMTVKVPTAETDGSYTIIHFVHPPNVGPALHIHPNNTEIFHILKGNYKFLIGNKDVDAIAGDTMVVPKGMAHKFSAGDGGGEFLAISPPTLENYFYEVSLLLMKGKVTWDAEYTIAKKYGQIFLEDVNHWKRP
jgi:mannose-6-phosphate isomerase-like protein (cupin superfamily)